jgi:hypothetical protein
LYFCTIAATVTKPKSPPITYPIIFPVLSVCSGIVDEDDDTMHAFEFVDVVTEPAAPLVATGTVLVVAGPEKV